MYVVVIVQVSFRHSQHVGPGNQEKKDGKLHNLWLNHEGALQSQLLAI